MVCRLVSNSMPYEAVIAPCLHLGSPWKRCWGPRQHQACLEAPLIRSRRHACTANPQRLNRAGVGKAAAPIAFPEIGPSEQFATGQSAAHGLMALSAAKGERGLLEIEFLLPDAHHLH